MNCIGELVGEACIVNTPERILILEQVASLADGLEMLRIRKFGERLAKKTQKEAKSTEKKSAQQELLFFELAAWEAISSAGMLDVDAAGVAPSVQPNATGTDLANQHRSRRCPITRELRALQ